MDLMIKNANKVAIITGPLPNKAIHGVCHLIKVLRIPTYKIPITSLLILKIGS